MLLLVSTNLLIDNNMHVQSTNSSMSQGVSKNIFFEPSGTPHDDIKILSDDEFHIQAASESWPGNGSASNPYRIQGYS